MLVPTPAAIAALAHGLPSAPLVLPIGLAADQRPHPVPDSGAARYRLLLALCPAAWADRALPAGRPLARSGDRLVARRRRAAGALAGHRGLHPVPDHDGVPGRRAS